MSQSNVPGFARQLPLPGQPLPTVPGSEEFPNYRYPLPRGRVRPEVSVCIVNWNCKDLLRNCLTSLTRGRQGVRLEVVVVDNGSTDGAADMVARDFPEVVLLRNPTNEGFARCNNRAVARSRGRYLFFLNNDTVVPPGTLRRLRDYARTHHEAGLIGPRLVDGRGRTQLSARGRPTVAALLHRISWLRWTGICRSAYRTYRGRGSDDHTRSVEVLMGAALFMPRTVFRACGRWDERYTFGGEDIALCARVAERYQVVHHPAVAITHFGRASSRQHSGYAYTHTLIGITRRLRESGTSRAALTAYKLAVTLDAPLQWLGHAARYAVRTLRGRPERTQKSRLGLQAVGHFLTRGLVAFWKT
jgi:GT2 family glycosyltransferase